MKEGVLHELPGGWVWTRLGEIAEVITGNTPSKKDLENYGNFIPFVKPPELNDCIVGAASDNLSEKGAKLARILPPDSVLVSCIGNLGKIGINKIPVAFNQQINSVIFPRNEIIPKYGFYYFQTFEIKKWLNAIASATTISIVNKSKFENIPISFPPLPEQRAIVSKIEQLFSDLDNGIENFKKAQAQLKLYRQSVLRAACEGKLLPTEAELARAQGREYEAADVLLARILKERSEKWKGKGKYKEVEAPDANGLPELPTGWCWGRLDSLAALKGGITKDQNRKVVDSRKIPYLRVANVQRGYLDLSEIKEIEAQESVISELLLKPGDILFNEGGDRDKLGRGCIWNGEIRECIHQNHVFRARTYSPDISNKIISWFGNSFGQGYFMKQGKQTTNLASINLTKLSAFPVPLPPLAEQRRIVAEVERRLSVSDKMEATIAESLQKAESLRQSILKEAFEGKLLNKNELEKARNASDWEPAEKLLERIRQEKQIKENNNKPARRKTHG